MPNPPISDEALTDTVEAYNRLGSISAVSRELGLTRSSIQNRMKNAERRGMTGRTPPAPTGFEVRSLSEHLDASGNVKGKSVRYAPEAGPRFEIPAGRIMGKTTVNVLADGRIGQQWIRHDSDKLSPLELLKIVRDEAASMAWVRKKPSPSPICNDNLLTVYPVADLHLASLVRADESGEDYNLAIATDTFDAASEKLFAKSPRSKKALILHMGDFTHQNDDKNITPGSGHFLQVSDPIYPTVRAGVALVIRHVYRALEIHDEVTVKAIRGNHDTTSWISLVVGLQEHFRLEPRVTIDGGEADYFFTKWGQTLIGCHHGHRMKPEQMASAMISECRQDWGQVDHGLFLHGHLHHFRAIDVLGVRVECMRTLAPPDQHHSGKYSSPRSLISITIDKETGEEDRASVNLPPVKRRALEL